MVKKLEYLNRLCRLVLNRTKRTVNKTVRLVLEPLGISALSKSARYHLDDKLTEYLPERGIFVEAGAADGYAESNTYYLEKFKKWRGVLIEPIPELYARCVKERPSAKVFNCALVSHDYSGKTVLIKRGHLMSTVKGALGGVEQKHLEKAEHFHGTDGREIVVPARTLTSVLWEAGVSHIDFFSLDVEGYELNVLKGLDFSVYRPTYMLIEFLAEDKKREAEDYIADMYGFVEKLSKRDCLYKSKK